MNRIVILGAGFGGLSTTLQLSRKMKTLPFAKDYEIVLIDRNSYHTFTPLLYEVATTSKATATYLELKNIVTYPLPDIFQNKNIRFVKDEVYHIDFTEKAVHLKSGKLKFDFLVLALGSETNYFDIPGLKENSLNLKTFDNAVAIRDTLWFDAEALKKESLNIVIGGGGSTGVELAGEIKEIFC